MNRPKKRKIYNWLSKKNRIYAFSQVAYFPCGQLRAQFVKAKIRLKCFNIYYNLIIFNLWIDSQEWRTLWRVSPSHHKSKQTLPLILSTWPTKTTDQLVNMILSKEIPSTTTMMNSSDISSSWSSNKAREILTFTTRKKSLGTFTSSDSKRSRWTLPFRSKTFY